MKKKKSGLKEIGSWVLVIAVAFTMAFLFNSKAYAKAVVDQSSMENTLFDSQQLIVDEISYNFSKPERGDIIIFYRYETKGTLADDFTRYIDNIALNLKLSGKEHKRYVKRVIGVEGDVIDIKDGCVYVNGDKLDEPYAKGITESNGMETPATVGKDELFVLGDNRVVSEDSRAIGMVDLNQVEGKVIYRVYPFNKMGKVK